MFHLVKAYVGSPPGELRSEAGCPANVPPAACARRPSAVGEEDGLVQITAGGGVALAGLEGTDAAARFLFVLTHGAGGTVQAADGRARCKR